MTPAKVIARLRRLAGDWRHEEEQFCKQYGGVVVPQSMRARKIKDTQVIDAAVEMIERLEAAEKELVELRLGISKQQSLTDAAQQLAEAAQRRADKLSARAEAAEEERDAAELMSLALRAKIERMEQQEHIGEIVAFGESLHEVSWNRGKLPQLGAKLYLLPGAQGEEK